MSRAKWNRRAYNPLQYAKPSSMYGGRFLVACQGLDRGCRVIPRMDPGFRRDDEGGVSEISVISICYGCHPTGPVGRALGARHGKAHSCGLIRSGDLVSCLPDKTVPEICRCLLFFTQSGEKPQKTPRETGRFFVRVSCFRAIRKTPCRRYPGCGPARPSECPAARCASRCATVPG